MQTITSPVYIVRRTIDVVLTFFLIFQLSGCPNNAYVADYGRRSLTCSFVGSGSGERTQSHLKVIFIVLTWSSDDFYYNFQSERVSNNIEQFEQHLNEVSNNLRHTVNIN